MSAEVLTWVEPAQAGALLIEVPHAGLGVDAASARWMPQPVRALAHDADLFVDELFARAPALGAALLIARMSRHVLDLNADLPPPATTPPGVPGPRHRAANGDSWLANPLPLAEQQRRRERYHQPYLAAIAAWQSAALARHGQALLLSAHSFSSVSLPPQAAPFADVVIGSGHGTLAAAAFINAVQQAAEPLGLSVARDDPFAGGAIPRRFGVPQQHCHALQIEINKRCYLDPTSLSLEPQGWQRIRQFAENAVCALAQLLQTPANGHHSAPKSSSK